MFRFVHYLYFLYLLSLISVGFASFSNAHELSLSAPQSLCPVAHAKNAKNESVMFLQHAFANGMQNLAMYLPNDHGGGEFKPVTFGSSSIAKCHYQSINLAAGADWGWHLVWSVEGSHYLNYARMDGVAWVSSPAKKLSKNLTKIGKLSILTFEQKVWIVWQDLDADLRGVYAHYSDDEGRTWQEEKRLTPLVTASDDLRLTIKENKPYLILNDQTEALAL